MSRNQIHLNKLFGQPVDQLNGLGKGLVCAFSGVILGNHRGLPLRENGNYQVLLNSSNSCNLKRFRSNNDELGMMNDE